MSNQTNALAVQQGGTHYKNMAIQPVEYITANKLSFIEGCVIKYISRHRNKNGLDDLLKAKHFIDLLIDLEYAPKKAAQPATEGTLAGKRVSSSSGNLTDSQTEDTGNIPSDMLTGKHYENTSDTAKPCADCAGVEQEFSDFLADALGLPRSAVKAIWL